MTGKPERVVRYGPTTTVLAETFASRVHQFDADTVKAWWAQTGYAWQCGICPGVADDGFSTLAAARADAETHAAEHLGATVTEVSP